MGKPIDLSQDEPRLQERLIELVNAEGALYNQGITCAIKDKPNTACAVCPIRATDELDEMKLLCDVGCEQEKVVTLLAVAHVQSS